MLHFDFLRFRLRGEETDGEILGQVLPADRQHRRMPDASIEKDGQIGRAATQVDHGHTQIALFLAQHRLARRERLQDNVDDIEPGSIDALDDVLRRGDGAGDHMHIHFKRLPDSPNGSRTPSCPSTMNSRGSTCKNPSLMGNDRQRPRTFDRPMDVVPRDFRAS